MTPDNFRVNTEISETTWTLSTHPVGDRNSRNIGCNSFKGIWGKGHGCPRSARQPRRAATHHGGFPTPHSAPPNRKHASPPSGSTRGPDKGRQPPAPSRTGLVLTVAASERVGCAARTYHARAVPRLASAHGAPYEASLASGRDDDRARRAARSDHLIPERGVLTQRHKDHKDYQRDLQVEPHTRAAICPTHSMVCFSLCSLCLCVSNSRFSADPSTASQVPHPLRHPASTQFLTGI